VATISIAISFVGLPLTEYVAVRYRVNGSLSEKEDERLSAWPFRFDSLFSQIVDKCALTSSRECFLKLSQGFAQPSNTKQGGACDTNTFLTPGKAFSKLCHCQTCVLVLKAPLEPDVKNHNHFQNLQPQLPVVGRKRTSKKSSRKF